MTRADPADAVIAGAYDARASEYIRMAGSVEQMDARDRDLISRWRDATPGRLLDAGCGPGHWTDLLDDGHREASGVDISEAFLDAARSRYPHLTFSNASLRGLPVADASLGGILAWYSLIHTHPADVPAVLAEFARVLAPGGSLLLGVFIGEPREPFGHAVTTAYSWSADALEELLTDAGFEAVFRERREREPGEISARPHGALIARRVPWAR
ncbi:class I SAM-dependent methyltransferase [Microbacterium sp. SA39]|uniref:class I SAM-dependent methyltransferase n=1 Tax=Microbacterium sp. SA39 TaxID=1263625 RepID=UPI0005FA1CD1|nr:class I SAM-dependent methyltransferase [Microbacterium sp. SA39]KJQ54473.1 putative S-adenosylmethionine-dependent methyltransferase [Microbacterium sp. SA39]